MATTKAVIRFTGDKTQVLDKGGDVEQTAPDIIFGFTIKIQLKMNTQNFFGMYRNHKQLDMLIGPTTTLRGVRSTLQACVPALARSRARACCAVLLLLLRKKKRSSHRGIDRVKNNAI